MSALSEWRAKRTSRQLLLNRARRSVVYWGKRAGSAHGKAMLAEARARYEIRKSQIVEADRKISELAGITSVSPAGLAMIAGFEGFRSNPYRDAVGVWTIGYGETRNIGPGSPPWSREYALKRLRERVDRDYLAPVLAAVKTAGMVLSQREADALASLVYNLGPGILGPGKTMGSAIHSRVRQRIADAFLVYDFAGGGRLPGLTSRRRAERALFLRG